MAKNKKPATEKKPANTGILKFGYVKSIVDIWAATAIVLLLNLALVFWGAVGIGGGISLLVRHSFTQGWFYIGTGLIAAGLVIPVFFALKKVYNTARAITEMQSEKLKGKAEEK